MPQASLDDIDLKDISSENLLQWANEHDSFAFFNPSKYQSYPHHTFKQLLFVGKEKEVNVLPQQSVFEAIDQFVQQNEGEWIVTSLNYDLKNEIEDIIDDETDHLRSFTKNSAENIKYSDTFVYEMLLLDEERHASLSDGFLEKIASPRKRKWLRLRYRIGNKIRHFWGSQRRVQRFVDKSISILVISLLLPFRGVLNFPATRKKNLLCRENGKFLL